MYISRITARFACNDFKNTVLDLVEGQEIEETHPHLGELLAARVVERAAKKAAKKETKPLFDAEQDKPKVTPKKKAPKKKAPKKEG